MNMQLVAQSECGLQDLSNLIHHALLVRERVVRARVKGERDVGVDMRRKEG